MASYESSSSPSDDPRVAREAHAALDDLSGVRARFGRRLSTPWWYKVASALLMALLFVGAGMPYESLSFGTPAAGAFLVVLVLAAGPFFLRELLKSATGASLDRYRNGWTVPSLLIVSLLVLCVALQAYAAVEWAPLVGAVIALVGTYLYELRIDRQLGRGEFPPARPKGRR